MWPEYLSEYKVLLTLDDGSLRQVDLAPQLDGEVFEPLKDMSNFKRELVESGYYQKPLTKADDRKQPNKRLQTPPR